MLPGSFEATPTAKFPRPCAFGAAASSFCVPSLLARALASARKLAAAGGRPGALRALEGRAFRESRSGSLGLWLRPAQYGGEERTR
jgi:hypothetical protein